MEKEASVIQQIYPILTSVLSFVVGIAFTLLGVIWKSNEKKQAEQDQVIKELQGAINELPEKYVLKDDFTRIVTQIQKEVKDIGEKIVILNENVLRAINELSVKVAITKKSPGGDGE